MLSLKINLGLKFFFGSNLGSKTFWVQKIIWYKFWIFQKCFGFDNYFGSKKNVGQFTLTIMSSLVFLQVIHSGVRSLVLSDLICNTLQPNTGRKKHKNARKSASVIFRCVSISCSHPVTLSLSQSVSQSVTLNS